MSISTAEVYDVRRARSSLWHNRYLIWTLAQRDLKAKYKSTMLGWIWSLVVPLATVAVYTVAFSVIFRAQPSPMGNGEPGVFPVWFFIGLVAFSVFTNGLTQSAADMLGIRQLLQKVYFPSYVSTAATMLAVLIQAGIELGVVMVILAVLGNVSWTWLLMPVVLVGLALFTIGFALVTAIANAHFRDVGQILPVVTRLMFFGSPIIYTLDMVPEKVGPLPLQAMIEVNPLTQWIEVSRDLLYGLTLPGPGSVSYLAAWTVGSLLLGAYAYRRWGRDIGETA